MDELTRHDERLPDCDCHDCALHERNRLRGIVWQFTAAELREAERAMNAWNAMTKAQRATALEAAKTACPAEAMRNLGFKLPRTQEN